MPTHPESRRGVGRQLGVPVGRLDTLLTGVFEETPTFVASEYQPKPGSAFFEPYCEVRELVAQYGQPRFWIVEDGPDAIRIIEKALQILTLTEVTVFSNAIEARRRYEYLPQKAKPDIVVADFHLPVVDGTDLLAQMVLSGEKVPVLIMFTGDRNEDAILEGYNKALKLRRQDPVTELPFQVLLKPIPLRDFMLQIKGAIQQLDGCPTDTTGLVHQ